MLHTKGSKVFLSNRRRKTFRTYAERLESNNKEAPYQYVCVVQWNERTRENYGYAKDTNYL